MAFDKTQISNLALSHVGDGRIQEFGEESKEGAETALWYDVCREQTLEAHNWNFARKRVALSLAEEAAPTATWAFRYAYPSDCVKLRWLVNPAGRQAARIPFQIEADSEERLTILTNLEDACCVYTRNLSNTSLFTPLYVRALSHCLASSIAVGMTGKTEKQTQQFQLFQLALSTARASNANEQAEEPPTDADWITARSGGTDFSPGAQVNIWEVPDGQN